jgi:hypothetical protein
MRKENCREEQSELPSDPLGEFFFSKFTLLKQSYAAALRHDNQHQQQKASQAEGKSIWHPVQQYQSQHEFQKPDLSVQTPRSSNNTVATVVHQIMSELSVTVSEKNRVMVITKMVLNLIYQNGC